MEINPYSLIGPAFFDLFKSVLNDKYTHYWLNGGRGSLKSSFIAISIVVKMMIDASNEEDTHAVVLRKVGDTLSGSVYEQLLWAIEKLGVSDYWDMKVSPLKITYKLTGQTILFRSSNGKEDYKKIKSIKFAKGYCKYVWFEELDEFFGMEEVRQINNSLLRGGDKYSVFYSYNPPKLVSSWVNAEVLNNRQDRIVHKSTYLDAPKEWLGNQFFIEAEELKKTNELAYRNEFLGEPTGTGGAIFTNVEIKEISYEERKYFDNILSGVDFGYAVDPTCYLQIYYNKNKKELYIFDEIYKVGMSNKQLADEIKQHKLSHCFVTCDSAEPKSIDELRSNNINARGAKKGPDSIEYGIKFLQKLSKIVIDINDCPNTAREFSLYEYETDKFGNFKAKYPDANNHSIDCCRYAIEDYTISNTWEISKQRIL